MALLSLAALSWAYLVFVPMPMPGEHGVLEPFYIVTSYLLWFVMMIAMMAPAVMPVVLVFHRSQPQRDSQPARRSTAFVVGYALVWSLFSCAATLLQVVLIQIGVVDSMTISRWPAWSAALLLSAGIYQWLPLKTRCLQHCRDPIMFLTHHYHPGVSGALRTGIAHGLYCLGCCVLLMLLLFVVGSMNLALVAALTALIVLERIAPIAPAIRHISGTLLVAAAVYMLYTMAT